MSKARKFFIMGIIVLLNLNLNAYDVMLEPIENLPYNNQSKLVVDEKELIKKDGYIYMTAKNFNLGMAPLDRPEMEGVMQNRRGSNVHCIINGEHQFTIYDNTKGVIPYMEDLSLFSVPMNVVIPKRIRKLLRSGPVVLFCALRSSYNTSLKLGNAQASETLIYLRSSDRKKETSVEKRKNQPMILYNEPSGVYQVGKPILLDFHLLNCHLSPGGNHVVIYIDGKRMQKALDWQPFLIRNLPKGRHIISLQLEGPDGEEIENPFKPQEKEIRVK